MLEVSEVGGGFGAFELFTENEEACPELLAIGEGGGGLVASGGARGELEGGGVAGGVGIQIEGGGFGTIESELHRGWAGEGVFAVVEKAEGDAFAEGEVGGVGLEGVVGAGSDSLVGEKPEQELVPKEIVEIVVEFASWS